MNEEHYLLMKDTPGEKTPGTLKKFVGMTNPKRVLRGELLRPIPRNEIQPRPDGTQHNFSLERDPAVTLYAIEDDVTPLSPEDYPLLRAIESPFDRFRVFSDPQWLEWGVNLKINSPVYVRLPSPNASVFTWSNAIVKYKGPVKTLPGIMFGVEIMDPDYRGKGSTNGVFQNSSYFNCKQDCGLFVSLDRLWIEPRSAGIQGEQQSQQLASGQQSYAAIASAPSHQSQSSRSHKKPPPPAYQRSSEVDPPPVRFRIDDHVVIFDRSNNPLHGSVRWMGRKNHIGRDMGEVHIGVEVGVSVNPTDIPGAKTGLYGLFAAKKNRSIIIPESLVVSAEAYVSKRERVSKERKDQRETRGDPPPYIHNPIAIAREFKMTETEFIEEQKKALKEHEEQKRKNDEQKVSREVKEALGESITAAEQQRLFDAIQSNKQAESGGKQGSPNLSQSSLDVGRRDNVKRQRSLQPWYHLYDTIPGESDTANVHRRIGAQGKSSSVAQAEGIDESFQSENHQFHGGRGGHSDYDSRGDRGGRSDHGGVGAYPPFDSQHKPTDGRAKAHEHFHGENHHSGGVPQYDDNYYPYGQALVHDPQAAQKSDPDYVNIYIDPKFQQYIQPNADEWPQDQQMPPDQHFAGATRSDASEYVDQPTGSHHQAPVQQNFAAATTPPGSSSPVNMNPNLTVGSRIQIPTQSPTEPFKYGDR